ncbi:hypothetical protein ACHAPJ_002989 [Fusarium lateritium]
MVIHAWNSIPTNIKISTVPQKTSGTDVLCQVGTFTQTLPPSPNKSPAKSSAKTSNSSSPKKSPKRKKKVEEDNDDDDNENGDSVNQRDKCRRVSESGYIPTSLSFGKNSKVIFEFKDTYSQLAGDQYIQFHVSIDYEKAKADCLFNRDALERTRTKEHNIKIIINSALKHIVELLRLEYSEGSFPKTLHQTLPKLLQPVYPLQHFRQYVEEMFRVLEDAEGQLTPPSTMR